MLTKTLDVPHWNRGSTCPGAVCVKQGRSPTKGDGGGGLALYQPRELVGLGTCQELYFRQSPQKLPGVYCCLYRHRKNCGGE